MSAPLSWTCPHERESETREDTIKGWIPLCLLSCCRKLPGWRGPSAGRPRACKSSTGWNERVNWREGRSSAVRSRWFRLRPSWAEVLKHHKECLQTDYSSWSSTKKDTFYLHHDCFSLNNVVNNTMIYQSHHTHSAPHTHTSFCFPSNTNTLFLLFFCLCEGIHWYNPSLGSFL